MKVYEKVCHEDSPSIPIGSFILDHGCLLSANQRPVFGPPISYRDYLVNVYMQS